MGAATPVGRSVAFRQVPPEVYTKDAYVTATVVCQMTRQGPKRCDILRSSTLACDTLYASWFWFSQLLDSFSCPRAAPAFSDRGAPAAGVGSTTVFQGGRDSAP